MTPLKGKYTRYNQDKFINRNLQKVISNRSRLLNRYRKKKKYELLDLHIKDS